MTDQEKRKAAVAIYAAHLDGKQTERDWPVVGWNKADPFTWLDEVFKYPERWRIKPEPVTRPWRTVDDFPKVGSLWIRGKGDYRQHLIVGLAGEVAFITASCGCQPVLCSSHIQDWNMEQHEWSEDRKNWHPCVVTEEPQ